MLGLGLLVERLADDRLPDELLVPVGLAALIAVASLVVSIPATATLATPLVTALAATGLVLARRPWARFDGWATASAVGVFVLYGAPVIASGTATFAGYIKLDDTATFLALADRVLDHGRSLGGLGPSSYEATLAVNLAHGYPLGAVLPLGIGGQVLHTETAWLYQPWMSFAAAALSLGLYHLVRPIVPRRPLAAAVSAIGALSALLFGYALWGGVKELGAAPLIVLAAALAARPTGGSARTLVPFAVACAAVLETLSVAGLVWLVPLIAVLVVSARRRVRALVVGAACGLVLASATISDAAEFLRGTNRATFASATELGNLVRSLPFWEAAGVWLGGDFRVDPNHDHLLTILLAGLVLGAAAVTAGVVAARRRGGAMLLALASVVTGAVAFGLLGSPWVAAKALAVASPVVLTTAVAGCVGLAGLAARRPGAPWPAAIACSVFAALAVGAGVLWSDALAYHDAWLAPRDQLAELQSIGSRFAGQGPALMTEYQPYGVRHFLRRLDAEGSSELRSRLIPLREGGTVPKGGYVDLDRLRLDGLLVYRTLVLRRSPTLSRPPSVYRLVWKGRWYEVWQRPEPAPIVVSHLSLGNALQPGGVVSCERVLRMARLGRVVGAAREANILVPLASRILPSGWTSAAGGEVLPADSGTLSVPFVVQRPGRYRLWVGGSTRGGLRAGLDSEPVGSISEQLQNAGQWLELGTRRLTSGRHTLTLAISLGSLAPGTGGDSFPLGPALLQPVAREPVLRPRNPRSLCGSRLDWVEAVGPSA